MATAFLEDMALAQDSSDLLEVALRQLDCKASLVQLMV